MGNIAGRGFFFCGIVCAFALLSSCGGGGGGGGGSSAPSAAVATGTATGTVIDGPISGAKVEIFDFTGNVRGIKLGEGTSDSSGNYSITLTPRPTGPVIVVASGGTYIDDATGNTVTLGSIDQLNEIVPASSIVTGALTAHVNPLNHIASSLVTANAGAMGVENAVPFAKGILGQQYGISVTDLGSNPPLNASNPSPTSAPSLNQRQSGVVIAGISQLASSLGVRPVDLIKALADDYSDGKLDGLKGSAAINMPKIGGGTVQLTATTGLAGLQTAITTFLGSANNKSGLTTMPPIATQAIVAPINTAGLLFTKSDLIPAFVTGTTSSVQLQVAGGTPPYNWTGLTACPSATVSSSGLLTATGAALSSGTSMSISTPCQVTVTDSRGQSTKVTFRITTVAAAPSITAATGVTMTAGIPGSVVVATATGGTPPYFFHKDTAALTPLGTSIVTSSDNKSAVLSGTPAAAGSYTFSVCAADLGRTEKCTNATVTVIDPPKANLTTLTAGSGSGTFTTSVGGTPCGTACLSFNQGSVVTITAVPGSGSTFAGWSGAGCSGTGTCTVTLNSATTVTGTFNLATPQTAKLTVFGAGSGSGTFTTSPSGTACGSGCVSFNRGTVVTLSATPSAGSVFAGWSGNGCSGTGTCVVTLNADTSVTTTFNLGTPTTVNLTKVIAGTGTGAISTSISGTSCGTDCVSFAPGQTITLTATPANGSSFAGWSGAGCSGTGTCTITLNSAQTVTATFNVNATPMTGTWVGTWDWSGTGSNGCTNFHDHGSFSMVVTQTGSTFSGTVNAAGLETRNGSCSLVSVDPASGTISGTISGNNLTYSFNFGGITTTLVFNGSGTLSGSTISASYTRTLGGPGTFNVTRQ